MTSTGKPELPRQPGSSAFYDSESSQPPPESSSAAEPESPGSNDNGSNNFFQTLDWEGAPSACFSVVNQRSYRRAPTDPPLFTDVRSSQDATESQGAGSVNDQEDLSDQSEGDSYSYSAPSGEPLSRDPSEPLFDADFQVGAVPLKIDTSHCVFLGLYGATDEKGKVNSPNGCHLFSIHVACEVL